MTKGLPGAAGDGMAQHLLLVAQPEQGVGEPGVAHMDLGRPYQALALVAMPCRQPAHQQQVDHEVEIVRDCDAAHAQGARQAGGVQQLGLVVGQHRPEPPQGLGRDARAELRDVALEMGADEVLTPSETQAVVVGQEARRKAAAHPQPVEIVRRHLERVEGRCRAGASRPARCHGGIAAETRPGYAFFLVHPQAIRVQVSTMALQPSRLTVAERRIVAEALLEDVISSLERDPSRPNPRELECLEAAILRFRRGLHEEACIQVATAAALVDLRLHGATNELAARGALDPGSLAALRSEFEAARRTPETESATAANETDPRLVIAALRAEFEAARKVPDDAIQDRGPGA